MVRDCYKEILRLRDMLDEENIPYTIIEHYNGYALAYPNRETLVCSVIEHDHSYGRNKDLLEIMGLLTNEEKRYDDILGYLSAKDVFNRIRSYQESLK